MQEHKQRWWAQPTYHNRFIPDGIRNHMPSDSIDIIPLRNAQSCVNGVLTMDVNNRPCCTTEESCNPRLYQFDSVDTYSLYG